MEPLYLYESQLRREAHRADVGSLGVEHYRLAGKDVVGSRGTWLALAPSNRVLSSF